MPFALVINLLVALAYALTGWLALSVTIPPHYVSVIFPSAGIGLAAVLIFGKHAAIGVFAGSVMVQILAGAQSGVVAITLLTFVPAVGASLQALAGAALTRHLIGFPNSFDTPRAIALFLFVVCPVSALINASISVPMLGVGGVIPAHAILFSALNWWLGDTLGTLLATPVLLTFLAHPKEVWRPRRTAITLPILAICGLTALVFSAIETGENRRIEEQFRREAENIANLFEKRLATQVELTRVLERHVVLSEDLHPEQFRRFVEPLLERHRGVLNFTWNPAVTESERDAFEARASAMLGMEYQILDRDESAATRTRPASASSLHLPILLVEPRHLNEAVIGLDPLSIPTAKATIEQARESQSAAVTAAFVLTQDKLRQLGVVIYHPVYRDLDLHRSFIGIVSSAMRVDDILDGNLPDIDPGRLAICLLDQTEKATPRLLAGPHNCHRDDWLPNTMAYAQPIRFAGREWALDFRAGPRFDSGLRTWTGWYAVVIGLFANVLLTAFLLITTGQARRISEVVEQRTAELASTSMDLRRQERILSRAQSVARMGSWEIDPQTQEVVCSEGLFALLDLPYRSAMQLTDLLALFTTEDRTRLQETLRMVQERQLVHGCDCHTNTTPPRVLHVLAEGEWMDNRLVRLLCTAQDVTATRQAERDIRQLALFDSLTGLPNRAQWTRSANARIKTAARHLDTLAVLFLDLDQFKTVNDSLGHEIGDQLLTIVARRLSGCMRDDDMIARLGGDEFVALLPRLEQPADAASVARKMLNVLAEPIAVSEHELSVSVSIGISMYPDDGQDVDTLLRHADIAMYSAKDGGRNNFQFFVPAMNRHAHDRLLIEGGLRRAIERQELSLHYQPQIDNRSDRLIGAEALLRWHHPDLGDVSPDRFIPVAENAGLISTIGAWAMAEAFAQLRKWSDADHQDLVMAVNISALQFRKHDFVSEVRDLLHITGVDPHRIEFEITESALLQPSDELLARLNELVALGITLALDDFGTGYSSLAYLKRLPIERIKLDRSFVRDLPGDSEDAAIASAAISMAHDLGMIVVAEGVETEAQRAFLQARGCDVMQGYLFGRPEPAQVFAAKHLERRPLSPTAPTRPA